MWHFNRTNLDTQRFDGLPELLNVLLQPKHKDKGILIQGTTGNTLHVE